VLKKTCAVELIGGVSLMFQKGLRCGRKHYILAALSVNFIQDLNMILKGGGILVIVKDSGVECVKN
jgi:hypothetical protein